MTKGSVPFVEPPRRVFSRRGPRKWVLTPLRAQLFVFKSRANEEDRSNRSQAVPQYGYTNRITLDTFRQTGEA